MKTLPRFNRCATRTLVFLLGLLLEAAASVAEPRVETFVYKRVGTLEIKADVYRPTAGRTPRPVIVYIHGGSLINLGRNGIQQNPLKDSSFPTASLSSQLTTAWRRKRNCRGLLRTLRTPSAGCARRARLFRGGCGTRRCRRSLSWRLLDSDDRIPGSPSALRARGGDELRRPVGPWQANPSRHPPHYETHLSRDEAWRQVSGPPIANGADRKGNGSSFNDFIRRNAEWPKAVSGWDPKTEAERFLRTARCAMSRRTIRRHSSYMVKPIPTFRSNSRSEWALNWLATALNTDLSASPVANTATAVATSVSSRPAAAKRPRSFEST